MFQKENKLKNASFGANSFVSKHFNNSRYLIYLKQGQRKANATGGIALSLAPHEPHAGPGATPSLTTKYQLFWDKGHVLSKSSGAAWLSALASSPIMPVATSNWFPPPPPWRESRHLRGMLVSLTRLSNTPSLAPMSYSISARRESVKGWGPHVTQHILWVKSYMAPRWLCVKA